MLRRRQFLQHMPLAIGLAVPAIHSLAKQPPASTSELLLQQCPIAGLYYHYAHDIKNLLQVGQRVELVREPHNNYDHRAVRIDWSGMKLGYVPHRSNRLISQMLDRGESLAARISHSNTDQLPLSIHIDIWAAQHSLLPALQ